MEDLLSFTSSRASTSTNRVEIDLDDRNAMHGADYRFSETTATLMSHQAIIDDLKAFNFMLKTQLAASEKRFQDLSAIWDKTTKQKADEHAILDSRRQLHKAVEENARLKAILKFRNTEDPENPYIEKELGYITKLLKMTFDFSTTIGFEIPDHIPPNSETEYLLRMAISGEEASNSNMLLSLSAMKGIKPLNLMRAMMSCALRYWIFESDWPRFDHCPCIKLHGYRELVSLQGGAFESLCPSFE
jgi:hypothetical protein